MEYYRARDNDYMYVKYEQSLIHNTALIASEENNIFGVLEYDIKDMVEAEVLNFNIFMPCNENLVFEGLIEELLYWNPYIKRIIYSEHNNIIKDTALKYAGFRKNSIWLLDVNNDIEVFKIDIDDITPEQLTVDEVKLNKVSSWIEKPEDVVVNCVKIDEKIVCIDGYSRLVAAYIKGFKYVYAYIEPGNNNIDFYKTCLEWCKEQNIFTINDLSQRIVTPEEHERLWIDKCQEYLKACNL